MENNENTVREPLLHSKKTIIIYSNKLYTTFMSTSFFFNEIGEIL